MPRYHVHLVPTDELWRDADPVITVTVDALHDGLAELNARALISTACDVQEIELAEEANTGRDFLSQALNEGDGVYRP